MAIANVVVNDATTPTAVAHTFVPVQDGNDARFVNDTGALTLKGQETLGITIKRTDNPSLAHTARLTMWDPTEVTGTDGVVKIDHGNSADCRFNFSPLSTEQERLNLVTMTINGLTAQKTAMTKLLPLL